MYGKTISMIRMPILLTLITLSQVSHADDVPVLMWSDVEHLVDSHPTIGVSDAKTKLAEASLTMVGEYPNPELGFGAGYGDPDGGQKGSFVWDLELTVPLEWVAERKYLEKQAIKDIEATEYEREAVRLEVLRELRRMFVVIAYDRELILSRSTTEQHLEQLEASMQLRFDEGDLRGVELTRVQIEHEKARIETAKIMAVASQHKNQLDLWLGGNLPDDFEVQFDLEDLPAVIALEDALSHAGSENPLVMAGVLKLQASELGVKAQKHAAFPEMAIGGFVNKELDATNYGGVFSMSIPLWNWNKAGIDEAAAQKIMAESEQDALVLQLQSRVIVAHCGASMNRQAAESYIEDVLPKVLTSVEDVQTAYDEGDADLLDLIDARRTQATTHLELLSVLLAFHLDVIELETLMGGHSS